MLRDDDDAQMSMTPIPSLLLYVAISLSLAALASVLSYRLASEEVFIPMF
jgi:hypothetical protein